jgi:hypothetical protein
VEEPLGVLALEHWCSVIDERVLQISAEHDAVQQVQRLVTQATEGVAAAAAGAQAPAADRESPEARPAPLRSR